MHPWLFHLLRSLALLTLTSASLAALSSPLFGQEEKLTEADFTSAEDCGKCHTEIYRQWSQSMHSRSFSDPVYRAVVEKMLEQGSRKDAVFCLSCHAPVASVAGETLRQSLPLQWDDFSAIAREGVTCDFCHTIAHRDDLGKGISVGAYVFPRTGSTRVKFGTDADAVTQEHPVEVSAFLGSAEFCSICHQFKHPVSGQEVQNTYREWLNGPYSGRNQRCQDCHMPADAGKSAEQGPEREKVHAHVFAGGHTEMVQKAATLTLAGAILNEPARVLQVTSTVTNSGSGHFIPSGVPGIRQMWLEIQVTSGTGQLLFIQRFNFGQRLVRAIGPDSLPWEAYGLVEDNRIGPEETRDLKFEVSLDGSEKGPLDLAANLYLQFVSDAASRRLELPRSEPVLMSSTRSRVPLSSTLSEKE